LRSKSFYMTSPQKSTVEEIRQRFDNEVDRFSNLETGQTATMDAPLVLELVTLAAARVNPSARAVLDIGCGAGNYTLKLLEKLPDLDATLVDLSRPMLDRAVARVREKTTGQVTPLQGDIRELSLSPESFDIVLASASLHHLRADHEWLKVFASVFASLRPGGSFWIADLITHDHPAVQDAMWQRYGEYLSSLGGSEYRDRVFSYVEHEDTPRSIGFQTDLLRSVGFSTVEVLHKICCFAAFGGIKSVRGV
jgi:tRNA (cmo5U34)-methyltransferase